MKRSKRLHSRMRHIRGLRQRWIVNTVAPIAVLLVLLVTVAGFGVANYYYSSMRNGLELKAQEAGGTINSYFMNSYAEYERFTVSFISGFEEKEDIELQIISSSGKIRTSTSGLTAGMSPGTPDIQRVMTTGKSAVYHGEDYQTGQEILAVSYPLIFSGRVVGALRYVTALEQMNRQILVSVAVIALLAVLTLLLVIGSNLIFINNVVEPVAVVSDTVQRISAGSYGVQIDAQYRDELGELVRSINDMSLKLSHSEKVKSEFISSVSHELRTPLTAINGWVETMLEDRDPEQLRRGLGIVLKESRRLTTMVEELLEFSKMEDGRFTLQVEEVDVQAEFEDTIFTYRELFAQEGIVLEYDPADDLLPTLDGDPERLRQVFCNVLDNAAKHGGSGKRITASIRQEDDAEVIRVRDYGPGVPVEELPYIKKKFYKGSSKARGSGIGLAVCDEIIRLHGGEFTIGNAEGGGCEVTIRLPAEK